MMWNLIRPTEDDKKRILIALETLDIIRQGFYQKGGRRIPLENQYSCSLDTVIPYPPEALDTLRSEFSVSDGRKLCSISVVDRDSLQAARELDRPLVLNFANARRPGGGFLYGAEAQEESLCRASSLYASISSPEAGQMYEYNRRLQSPVDSDYMLFSPKVSVFRDADGGLLDAPYEVSVITVPAPDRNGRAGGVSSSETAATIRRRLRNVFAVASLYECPALVLGAWGCGAFGNDAAEVAQCFFDVLIGEGYGRLFDEVVFAVLNDAEKLDIFRSRFCGNQ